MPPQPSPTTVLIIPLILNTLSASPPQQTWAPVENSPEIVYQIPDQPNHDLVSSSDPSAEHHPSWLPPMDICGGHFGTANTTDSSVLLLLLVSLPGQQDQPPARHYCGSNNTSLRRRAPWTSLPLEPGVYGMPPQAGDKPVCFNPFGSNISLDVGLFSTLSSNSSLLSMPPMIGTEDGQIYDHPVGASPAVFGFVLCGLDGNDSFIPIGRRHIRGGTRYRYRDRYRERQKASISQPRKLLGHPQVLVRKKQVVAAAGFALGLALLPLCFVAGLLYWCMRTRMPTEDERPVQAADHLCPSRPRPYSHRELAAATCRFSDEGKIGRGGFGPVYRGYLRGQGCHVAIKVMSQEESQGRREFQAEVKVMTRLRHRNIVHLLGWCDAPGGLMLVYELVPNGSLDKHLYDPQNLLSWSDRYRIALGVGSAILYLHTECEQCVLHGDIKPANILLDRCRNAKLGDFGLARLVDHGTDSSYTTQVVAGTPGYMDPEFVNTQRPCAESDVFSFGVVLLEIACGRRPTTTTTQSDGSTPLLLLNWVRGLYSADSILAAADRRLDGEFDDKQMRRVLVVGLWCAHHDQSQRPSIVQAMDLLRRQDSELPPLLVDLGMHSSDAVRSLEEIAYGDFSAAEDSASESPASDTAYHTSTDSSCLPE